MSEISDMIDFRDSKCVTRPTMTQLRLISQNPESTQDTPPDQERNKRLNRRYSKFLYEFVEYGRRFSKDYLKTKIFAYLPSGSSHTR